MYSKSENQNMLEIHDKQSQKLMDEALGVTYFDDDKNLGQEYKNLKSILPEKLSMLQQEITIQQMIEIIEFFRLLIKYPNIPEEVTNPNFILVVLSQVQRFQNDELLLKFVLFISEFYDNEFFIPPQQLMEFSIQIILTPQLPLQVLSQKIIANFLVFLCSTYNFLDKKTINNPKFYSYLTQFFNVSINFNSALTYLFSVLIVNCSSEEVLSFYPTLIGCINQTVIPPTIQSINENETSLNIITNITSLVSGFATRNMELGKKYLQQNSELILPLYDFWGLSDDINSNLLDILETFAKTAILMFPDPNSVELQMAFFNIIDICLNKGGAQIIISSLNSSTEYTTESLLLLKSLIRINFARNTSFLFKDQFEFLPIFRQIVNFCIEGRISERCAAGCCISKVIKLCPDSMMQYLTYNSGVCSYLTINSNDISIVYNLSYIGLFSDLLDLDNDKLSRDIFKALIVISKKFNDIDKMHEFREECASYCIEEKIIGIADSSKNDKTYVWGNDLYLTAFGVLPFSEIKIPN